MKRVLALAPFLVLAPVPAYAGGGCYSAGPAAPTAATTIAIEHACFGPVAARVAVGAEVTWDNTKSGLDHNLSGPGIEFVDLPQGARHTVTFDSAGLYPYACTLHPGMSGVVVVGADVPAVETPAVAPVATTRGDDGGSYVPLGIGVLAVVLVAGLVVVTFGRPERGVPVPAR
jgi:plastocyanin